MSDKNPNLRRDLLGIALFAAGAFLTVVVALCYWKGAAASDYAGSFWVDKELIRWLGRPACLVLGVVACAIGARLFLIGPVRSLARSLLVGGVCLALGTSILMGALNPDYGGVFGQLIGSWASANLTKAVGIPLGMVCVFVPAWFAWLRPSEGPGEKAVRELQPAADRSTEASSGVTAEEAAELIPRRVVKRDPGAEGPTARPAAATPRPLDPLPKAAVPAGATPLETKHDPLQRAHSNQAPAVPERAAADLPLLGDAAVQDLADARDPQEPSGKRPLALQPVDELEEVGPPVPLTASAPAPASTAAKPGTPATKPVAEPLPGAAALRPSSEPTIDLARDTASESPARSEAQPLGALPLVRPSWEADETGDDIPVDAYGTPLTLVEELRRDSTVRAASTKEEALEQAARETGVEDAELAEDDTPRYFVAAAAPGSEDEPEEEAEEEPEEEARDERDRFPAADGLDEQHLEPSEDEELAEDEPFSAPRAKAAAERAEDPEFFGVPEAKAPSLFEGGLEQHPQAARAVDDDEEPSAGERESEDDDEALRREAPLFAAPRAARESAADDDEEPDAEAAALDAADEAQEPEPAEEREFVLAPRTPPFAPVPAADASEASDEPAAEAAERETGAASPATEPELSEEDELVYKAGVLFLERQRVAVSMLQREFGLDFERATQVLDRLQSAGLIGPYLGGQRRDILLTLDQWRGRALAR